MIIIFFSPLSFRLASKDEPNYYINWTNLEINQNCDYIKEMVKFLSIYWSNFQNDHKHFFELLEYIFSKIHFNFMIDLIETPNQWNFEAIACFLSQFSVEIISAYLVQQAFQKYQFQEVVSIVLIIYIVKTN